MESLTQNFVRLLCCEFAKNRVIYFHRQTRYEKNACDLFLITEIIMYNFQIYNRDIFPRGQRTCYTRMQKKINQTFHAQKRNKLSIKLVTHKKEKMSFNLATQKTKKLAIKNVTQKKTVRQCHAKKEQTISHSSFPIF